MQTFIPFEEALRIVLAQAVVGPAETIPLAGALGRTLAEPLRSDAPIPPFDNSAMDGFAVRTGDFEGDRAVLDVAFEIPAGAFPERRVEPGRCARIMTGAPFPEGADAVVPVEDAEPVDGEPGRVRLLRRPAPGDHVRRAGEDVAEGAEVVPEGTVCTPPVVGMAAALGYGAVSVRVAPRVAVLATGDELVDAAETPGPGQIRNTNGPTLAAQVLHAGGLPVGPFHARDDEADLRGKLKAALEADVLVVSGGVSVGDYDLVKDVLDEMGLELLFWKVRQRPGKPFAFGTLGGRAVFGLPGNPVSSSVGFEQYVRPFLAAALGRRPVVSPRETAVLGEGVRKKAGLHFFTRGRLHTEPDGRLVAVPVRGQGSHQFAELAGADCLIHLPEPLEDPPAGTRVEIERLAW